MRLSLKKSIIMEFNEKLQELRKKKGFTQEELAKRLFVSRTAISKWESGRGYPNIDSLKAIAKVFSVTVDELLSSEEVITIAEENEKQKEKYFRGLVCGLLDMSVLMLLALPLFALRADGTVQSVSLFDMQGIRGYIRATYYVLVIGTALFGILELALQSCLCVFWIKNKTKISLLLSIVSVTIFILSLQPYASIFVLALAVIKVIALIKPQ